MGVTSCSRLLNGEQKLVRGRHGIDVAECAASSGNQAPGMAQVAIRPDSGGVKDDREAELTRGVDNCLDVARWGKGV